MKAKHIAITASVITCVFVTTSPLHAEDTKDKLEKAKNTEKNIKQAEPPQVSTETKKSPVGLPASDFKPTQKPITIKEPPSPVSKSTTTAVNTSTSTAKSSNTDKTKKNDADKSKK